MPHITLFPSSLFAVTKYGTVGTVSIVSRESTRLVTKYNLQISIEKKNKTKESCYKSNIPPGKTHKTL